MNRSIVTSALALGLVLAFVCSCASFTSQPLKENDTIVFLGDSITEQGALPGGYVTLVSQDVAKAYPGRSIQVIGAGISGNKVPDCQKRLEKDVLQKNPTVVFVYIGINDVWHWDMANLRGTTKEDFESGLHDLIGRINDAGARVIMCTPTVIGEKTDGTNKQDAMLEEYAAISRKVAKETGAQMLDLRKACLDYLKKNNTANLHKGVLTVDGVHLNPAGNRFVADLMLDALSVPQAD